MFSDNEISLMADCLNGIRLAPQIAIKGQLKGNIMDAILIDGLDSKWSVDRDILIETLDNLTEHDSQFVYETIRTWWESTPPLDLKDLHKQFSGIWEADTAKPIHWKEDDEYPYL